MATTENQVILNIKMNYEDALYGIVRYQEAIKSLQQANKDLEKNNEDLRKAYKNNEISYEEMTAKIQENTLTIAANNEAMKENKAELRSVSKELQNDMKIQKAANDQREDSLVSLRAELSNLTKSYDNLSATERKTAKGQDLAKAINKTTTEIKEAEEATQRYYRNVGNYENAIKNAMGANSKFVQVLVIMNDVTKSGVSNAFNTAKTAVAGFGKQLLTLLANPIVATFAVIAAAIMLVVKGIKSSEENSNKLKVILAPLERILTGILNIVQSLTASILNIVSAGAALIGWIGRMAEKLPVVGGHLRSMNDELRENIRLEQERQALEKQGRTNLILDSKDRLEIAKLRKRAAAEQKTDTEAYLKTMGEIDEVEKKAALRRYAFAVRERNLAKEKAAQAQNDAATNQELAEKEAAVNNALAEYYERTTRDAGKVATAQQKLAKETTNAGKSVEDLHQKIKETADAERDAIRAAEDALRELIENNVQRQTAAINTEYDRRIEDLNRQKAELKEKGTLSAAAEKAINDNIVAQAKLRDKQLQELADATAKETLEREERRLSLLLEASQNDVLKQRELQLAQLDVQEQFDREEIEKSVQNEQERENLLLALQQSYNAQRLEVEKQFDDELEQARLTAIQQDYEERIFQAGENELEALRLQRDMKLELLNESHQLETESDEEWRARQLELQKNYYEADKELDEKRFEMKKANAEAIAGLMGTLSDAFGELGESNKAFAKLSKVLALGEIAVNTGVALAAGIKQAQSVPFPANIAAVATTVATILANIATAIKTVNSAKFAEGGLVTGAGTGTSDSITARVSNGESIMTANSTAMFAPLLSSLNQLGGGVPIVPQASPSQQIGEEFLAAAVARGMEYAPRPVVSVEEIHRVSDRVEVIENISQV